jgi:hypothetical protein
MTPKEKAKELFKKFYCMPNNSKSRIKNIEFDTAKQCALIAVDEVLSYSKAHGFIGLTEYWEEVKQEIEKL